MNRIYQGRVTRVEIVNPGDKEGSWKPLDSWLDVLWGHHEIFQDAVNYYIVALASLGTSRSSKLTRLRELIRAVWDSFERKGQRREGMSQSLKRTWQLSAAPTLAEAVERFTEPLVASGVPSTVAEKATEFLLHKLGGDAAIQQGGREFLPMFCDPAFRGTYKLSQERRERTTDEARLQRELQRNLSPEELVQLARSISLGSVVNLQPGTPPDTGTAVIERLRDAARTFKDQISAETLDGWLGRLDPGFSLPKRRGGNINVRRADACSLFLAFPNPTTKAIFQSTFPTPKEKPGIDGRQGVEITSNSGDDVFSVSGEDPIKLARGTRGLVFPGFTALPLWGGDGRELQWKEFDIAAFKEALKVYNQFQQNLKSRDDKLDLLALKLLVMDGECAIEGYLGSEALEVSIRERLCRLWRECGGKPALPSESTTEEASLPRFKGDARINRLRQIINDDLAEEYRLTDGRRTPYGLRRRTIKGWSSVRREWIQALKGANHFSPEARTRLKQILDEMRGGERREQIGSHKLFEALLSDEAAWKIWCEGDEALQAQINANGWATDPLEAFREYCETREALEEVQARPLNFTPADARHSRRLFTFSDVCSFGKKRGEFKHDANQLAVTVPVAVRNTAGEYSRQRCRLLYSAPRLLRDGIRSEDGSYQQDWTQPMMRALFGEIVSGPANPQELEKAAVQLMPDCGGEGERRILLNFPMDLDSSRLHELLGKAALWQGQFVSWKRGAQLPFLRWPNEFDDKEPHRWFQRVPGFRVLAVDLGTRHAAAIGVLECSKERKPNARFIGNASGDAWFGRYSGGRILRLPGENAEVWRVESSLDKDGRGMAFREELHGEKGRLADKGECQEAIHMLAEINQCDLLGDISDGDSLRQRLSFPEINDKLLVALRRAQNWIAHCVSWHWKLTRPESEEQRQAALAEIREQERIPEWKGLADAAHGELDRLRTALEDHIVSHRIKVREGLLCLTSRILPLRGRVWEWVTHPDRPDCHLLRQREVPDQRRKPRVRGQRGLSMARIEQLSELRRRWQSLNQSLRRQLGQKPLTASEMRNALIPDPCPDILRKLENLREQRVNQTAHQIVAKALGLELREPESSAHTRAVTDTHGEYKVRHPAVDIVVLEDLTRYVSEQGRARSENTRLMRWCHRAITLKVKMLLEPFGIPLLETPAAYSSRFCSLTGLAGFRAAEVGWGNRHDFRWRVLLDEAQRAKRERREPSENAAQAAKLFRQLEELQKAGHANATLLAPQPGGPIFVAAKNEPNPSAVRESSIDGPALFSTRQADLNAAINLAFRAVAHPECAHIHHRLRTERTKASRHQPEAILAREPRRFGKKKVRIETREGDALPKERNSNFFYDEHGIAPFGRARIETDPKDQYLYASGPALWKSVNDRLRQWIRCNELNLRRLSKWRISPEDDLRM